MEHMFQMQRISMYFYLQLSRYIQMCHFLGCFDGYRRSEHDVFTSPQQRSRVAFLCVALFSRRSISSWRPTPHLRWLIGHPLPPKKKPRPTSETAGYSMWLKEPHHPPVIVIFLNWWYLCHFPGHQGLVTMACFFSPPLPYIRSLVRCVPSS